ncbi:MAG: hypothetical protein EXQ70_01290 [Solirubrobacterales bacterium]|nr:hypothetical protein [Solirubrobacterales bacterium]
MRRRARALAFLGAAATCAALAAMLAGSYRQRVEAGYGPLREVVVAVAPLEAGRPIGPREARGLAVRRVPVRFAPAGALRRPADALGQAPTAPVPAGSYLLAGQLALPGPSRPKRPSLGQGRRPVQIGVSGAAALLIGGAAPEGGRVDVVVSEQAGLGGHGRTYVAASSVPLLALPGPGGPGSDGTWQAILALTRAQALRLIDAEGSARQIRLLPRP